jgi:hypothetical protein
MFQHPDIAAALVAERHRTLLAEAEAARLGAKARRHRQETRVSAARRSLLLRFRGLPAAAPQPPAVTAQGQRLAAYPISAPTATSR